MMNRFETLLSKLTLRRYTEESALPRGHAGVARAAGPDCLLIVYQCTITHFTLHTGRILLPGLAACALTGQS